MKNILIGVIIMIFLSLQANGQQSKDTLYLKNGYKAVGKLLRQSKSEYRFQTSEGLYLTFSPDEIEKIVTTQEMTMRKVNLDTLNVDQLNLYMDKAVKMRNQGRALTLSGVGVLATGIVAGVVMLNNTKPHGPPEDPHGSWAGYIVIGLAGLVGIPCTFTGIPLWAVGGNRKAKAELTLKKYNLASENSMSLGLVITLRF